MYDLRGIIPAVPRAAPTKDGEERGRGGGLLLLLLLLVLVLLLLILLLHILLHMSLFY